ncbi:SET domain-containing protein-lysine N-methyltransferase [Novosphingobium sp. PP1Y]|uniref:SET domain-containing protein-lysine N-methyltransferase n=1 Tax=Novosphingobium sp. PP1Y TaxID=702113 RepID=UPI0002F0673F|nr:SET domain-containing protein-lysine N-methyltransferase [Novosphingobium sp. PP1Y]
MFIQPRGHSSASEAGEDRLVVCDCETLGLCVRALAPFAAGEVLDRFNGEVSADLLQHSLQVSPGMHVHDTRFVGYLSHGCEPNCRLDMERFELVALSDIDAGEVLTIDYAATEDVLYRQFACHCAAQRCRAWITGRAESANEEGRRILDGQAKPLKS